MGKALERAAVGASAVGLAVLGYKLFGSGKGGCGCGCGGKGAACAGKAGGRLAEARARFDAASPQVQDAVRAAARAGDRSAVVDLLNMDAGAMRATKPAKGGCGCG